MRFTTLIVRNLIRRGVRSALTVLGLGIGIAAVVALLGLAWGFEKSFLTVLEEKGIDLVVSRAGVSSLLTSTLNQSLEGRIRAMPGVKAVTGTLVDIVSFEDANLVTVLANGWEPGSFVYRGVRVLKGRELTPDDGKAVMLGRVLALNLGKTAGDTVDIAGEPCRVAGIFESDSWFENGGLVIPRAELQRMMGRQGLVTGFVVAADSPDRRTVEALKRRIEAELPGIAAVSARDHVQNDLQIRLVKSMAWATSFVALLLGSVGILNTMMMTVFERTGEIGVLRALGWKRSRVLNLIMGEALALGLLGSVVGCVLGFAGVRALALSPTASNFVGGELPPAVLGVGLAMGIGLSLLGGLYPALRGASLNPIEALRHE